MKSPALTALNHKIPPPILTVAMGGLMWLTAQTTPRLIVPDEARLAATALLLIPGLVFLGSGFLAFRRAKTTINPVNIHAASNLVTAGVFRISRNPMYVGLAALLTAWACYLSAPYCLIGVAVFVLFIRQFQIFPEEQAMRDKFGSAFEAYQQRVRRWL